MAANFGNDAAILFPFRRLSLLQIGQEKKIDELREVFALFSHFCAKMSGFPV